METVEEVPVEPVKASQTGKNAFAAARATLQANSKESSPEETAPPTEDAPPTEKPTEPSETVADQPTETTSETDHLLTAEEVAKLTPKEFERYKRLDQAWTQKTQKLAADRKEWEPWNPLIEALKTNPDAAIEHLAKQRGFTVAKAATEDPKTQVDAHTAEALAQLPEEWQFLKPVFDQFGKTLLASVEGRLKPIAEAQTQIIGEAVAAETKATLEAFASSHKGWEKHEVKMMELGKKIIPTAGSMTDLEYMELLYKMATIGETEADKTQKVVAKINRAAASVEPNRSSGLSNEKVEHVLPPPGKRSIRDAYDAAKRGETWGKT